MCEILGWLLFEVYMSQASRDAGQIGGLSKVAIYPVCTNSLQKVVVCATPI